MSAIRDEAEKQFRLLTRQFIPVPAGEDKRLILNALCEAGSGSGVEATGDLLLKGYPYDRDGHPRTFFPNTAHIAAVVMQVAELRDQKARLGALDGGKPCGLCNGTGFVPDHDANGYSFVRRCICLGEAA